MTTWSRETWNFIWAIFAFFGEKTQYGKILKILFRTFLPPHWSTLLCSNEIKFVRREIGETCGPFGRSRPFKFNDFCTNRKLIYGFLSVIYTNLPAILHRLRDIASKMSKIAILGYPSCVWTPNGGVPLGRSP